MSDAMPEAIMGAVWAFSWGVVAASGALGGAILGKRCYLLSFWRNEAEKPSLEVDLEQGNCRG
jgi:hypothetical protein